MCHLVSLNVMADLGIVNNMAVLALSYSLLGCLVCIIITCISMVAGCIYDCKQICINRLHCSLLKTHPQDSDQAFTNSLLVTVSDRMPVGWAPDHCDRCNSHSQWLNDHELCQPKKKHKHGCPAQEVKIKSDILSPYIFLLSNSSRRVGMAVGLLGFTEEEVSSLPVTLRKGFLEKTCTTKIYKQHSSGRHKHPEDPVEGRHSVYVCVFSAWSL